MICNIDAKQLERTVAKTFTDMANMALDTNVIDIDGLIKKMNTDVNKSIEAGGGEIDPTIGKTYAMLVPDIVNKLLSSNHSEAINLFLPARVDFNRIQELRQIINEGGIKAENEIDKILAQGPVEDVKSTMDYVNSPFAISLRRQQKVSEKNEAKTSISRNVKKIINTLLNKLFGVSDNPIKKTVFSSIVYSPESNVSDFLSTFDNVTNPVMSEIMEAMSSDTKLNEFKEKYNGFNIKLVSDKHIKEGEFSNKVLETIKNKKNKEEGFWLVAVNDKGEVIKFNEDGSFNPEGTENFVLFANKPNNINAIKDLQNYYADIFGYRSFAALSSLSKQQGSEGKKAKKIKEDIDQFISEETKKYEKLRERASKDNDVVLDLIGINRGNVTEIESDQSLSPNNKSEINFNKIKESLKEKGKQAVLTFVSKISGNDTFGIPDGAAVINIMEGTSVVDVIKLERPRLHQVDIDVNGKKEGLNSVIAKIVANEYEIGSKFGSSEWINNATTVIGKYINTNDFHLRINDKGQVEFFVGRKGVMHLKPGIPVTEKNYQPILELIEKIDGIRDTGIEGVTEKQLSKVGVQRIGDSIRIDNVYYHIDTLKVHFNNSLANGQGRLISIEGNKVVENDLSYADFVSDNFGIAYKFDSGTGEVERTRPSLNLRPSNETLDRVNGVNKTKSGERVIPKTDIDSNYMSHDNTTVTIKDGGEGIELEINETTSGKAGIREALFEINNNTYNYEKVDISNEVSGGLKGEWKVVQDFLKYISLSENAPSRNQLKEELLKYFDEANVDKMLGNEEGLNRDIINPLREEINREIIELEKKKGDSEQLKLFKQIDQGEFIPVSKEAEAQAEAWYKSEKMKPLSDAVPFTNARNIVNNLAVGEFSEHGITLYKGSSMTDVYHESWHAFSQGFLTRDEKVSLYNDVRKLKGSFKSYTGETVKFSEATYLQIEEFLAEDFREFMINGQKYKRSLPARNSIFTKIWNFLKYIFGERNNRNQVTERMVNGKIKELYDNLSIGKFEGRTYSTENFMFDRLNKMSSGDSLIVMNPLKKSGNSLKGGRNSLNPTETKLVFDTMLHIFGNELQKKLTSLTPEQYKERQDIISKSKKSNTDLLKLHELYKQDSTDSSILSLAHDRDSLKEMFTSIKNEMESMSSNFSRIKNSLEQQGKESGYVQKSKINGLQENINLLDWAIENFGDLDKSFSNLVKDGGVVSYFLNNATEFFGSTDSQKESIIDLLSDEDSYQMEVGINTYGSAGNEVDVNSRLSNELKAIFSTISKYDSNGKPEVNQFGIPKIENAEVIKNKLLSIVADSVDSQQFIERIMSRVLGVSKEGIIDSSSIDPTITELVNRIGHPNSTNTSLSLLNNEEHIKTYSDVIGDEGLKFFDNSVYEVLGFKTSITQDNKSYYRGQIEEPTIDKDGNLVLYAREDELYKRAGLKSKGVSMTDDLQSAIEYGNGQLEVAQNLLEEEYGYDVLGYEFENKIAEIQDNGYYLIQIPKNISNEIVKEAGEVKVIGDKIVIPKGQYKIEQVIDSVDTEITPQQKQQAQQLYSQYLEQNPDGSAEEFKNWVDNRIGHPNSTNLTTQMLWSNLYSAYNIKEVSIVSHLQEIEPADSNFDVVDIDEDGNPIKVEPRKNTKSVTKIINLDPATKSLGIAWENSFQRRKTKESKEYLEETYRNETVLNLQNVVLKDSLRWNVRMINKGGTEPVASPNPNHLSEFPEAKFLRSIGMDFPVNADAMSALKYSGDDNYHYYGIRQIINRLNDINNHNHWVAKLNKGKLIEIKSLRDIFAERSLLKSDGTFNPANSLDTYYKRILQLANKYTTSDQSHSVTTPDNKQIYTYTIPNSLITSLSLLNNEEHIKTYSDVIVDERLKFFDNSVYPWANDSAIINSLFDMENGGIRRKDKHGNAVKIDYNYLMGIYTKYTENVNSLKKTESTRDISQKIGHVTFDEKFVSDFHNMIKNFSQETVRHADKSTYSYLGLSGVHNHITGEIDTHFATIDDFFTKSEDGSDNDAQARWKHYSRNKFYSESGRIAESIRLQKLVDENNKLQNKEDLYYSKRLLENGKNFVLLDGIISDTGIKEDIIKKIEKIVDDNPGVKDKVLFDIVKSELSSDVEILTKVDESFRSLQDRITSDVEERINKLSSEMETEGGMISDDIHSQILKLLREKGYSGKDQLLQEYKRYNRIPNDKQFESLSHKYSVRIASRMYAINSILGNMENTVMLYGDPAQYKNIDDLIKRSAGNASTGNIARTDTYIKEFFNNTEEYSYRTKLMNDGVISKDLVATPWSNKFRTTVVKDVNTTSSYFEHLETLAKQIKDESKRKEYLRRIEAYRISENNGGMNIADAQAFISFDSYRKYSIAIGAWSNTQEMLYRKVVNGEEVSPFDVTEGFPILKLQYQGVIDNSLKSTNLPIMAQHKMSLAPIIPNEKGVKTNLDMLHEKMIREGIDYVVMESGSKMADYTKNGKLNEFYDGGNINGEEFIVQEIQLEYLKRQIEAHAESENDVSLASQMRKLIIDGLAEKGGFISGKEHLVENYMKSLDELVDAKMSDLEENAGITINNKVATSVDKTKFINYFLNRVGKSQLTQNEIEILEYMKGKKNPDLSYTFGSNRLQKMVANLIANDLIKMRVTGAFMVQRSSIGTEAAGEFNMDSYKGESTNETKKLFDNTLPYYRVVNGKTLPMGVKVSLSGDFRYLLKLKHNDGKEIGTRERLNEMIRNEEWLSKDDRRKMITMIGPRIPTQGHNSMEFMQIHEFLPSYNVNTIVLPREIVIKNGSDFDFDKLAIMKPNYSIQKNGYVINKSKLKEALSSKKTRDIVVSRDNVERVIDYLNNGGPIEELSSDAAMIYDLVIDNKGDTVIEYANGDDTAAKENRFFQSMIDILSDESIFMELVSPLDSEYLGGISNNLSPIERNYKKEYNNFSDIVDYRYHLDRHEAFGLGRDSLGITATFTTMKSMFNMIGYTLPEYVASGKENATGHDVDEMYKPLLDYIETTKGDNYDFKYDKANPENSGFFNQIELAATIRDNFRQRLLFKHNNRNGIDLSQLKGADKNANYNISDITNELMNGFLDMAKGDWVISINAVKEATPKLLFMLGAGTNPDVAISIISNPLIKRYTSLVSKNKSVMGEMFSEVQNTNKHARNMAVREILKGEGFNYSADFVTINNAENIALVLANGKLKGMFNEQSVIDRAVNPTEEITNLDRELFLHYMEIEKMSRQVNNFTTTFNLDTQKTSTIADILEKKASIDDLKNNLRIKEGLVNKMLSDTPVGKFFIQDIQLKVLGELFPFATDKTIVGRISKVQKEIDNHANTFVESFEADSFFASDSNTFKRLSYLANNPSKLQEMYSSHLLSYLFIEKLNGDLKSVPIIEEAGVKSLLSARDGIFVDETGQLHIDVKKILNEFKSESEGERFIYSEAFKEKYGVELDPKTEKGLFNNSLEYLRFIASLKVAEHKYPFNYEFLQSSGEFQAIRKYVLEKYSNDKTNHLDIFTDKGNPRSGEISYKSIYPEYIKSKALITSINFNKMFISDVSYVDILFNMIKRNPALSERFAFINDLVTEHSEYISDGTSINNLKMVEAFPSEEKINQYIKDIRDLISGNFTVKGMNQNQVTELSEFFSVLPVFSLFQSSLNINSAYSINKYIDPKLISDMISEVGNDFMKLNDTQKGYILGRFEPLFIRNNEKYYKSIRSQNYNDRPVAYERMSEAVSAILPKGSMYEMIRKSQHGDIGIYKDSAMSESIQQETLDMNGSFNFIIPSEIIGSSNEVINEGFVPEQIKFTDQKNKIVVQDFGKTENLFSSIAEARGMEKESLSSLIQKIDPATFVKINNKSTEIFNNVSRIYKIKSNSQTRESVIEALNAYSQADNIFIIGDINKMKNPSNNPTIRKVNPEIFYVEGTGQYLTMLASESKRVFVYNDKPLKGIGTGWFEFNSTTGMFERMDVVNLPAIDQGKITATYSKPNVSKKAQNSLNRMFSSIDSPISLKVSEDVSNGAIDNFVEIPVRSNDPVLLENMRDVITDGKQELNPNYKIIVDNFIGDVKAKRINGLKPALPFNGIGGESGNNTLLGIQMENGKYQGQEGYAYLSKRLYEEFGYFNKDIVNLTKGTEFEYAPKVIDGDGKLITDDVLEEMKKKCK